jgi:protein-disulfide isomerase
MRNILIAVGGIVVVVAIAVGGYFVLSKGQNGSPPAAPAATAPPAASPTASPMASPAASPAPAPTGAAPQIAQAGVPSTLAVEAGDHVMGDPKAPVTVIEYASMTCPHCADFAMHTFPEVKKQYIDTGKVRWVFRDFPLDQYAVRGSMLAECSGNDRYFAIIDILFSSQQNWIKINDLEGTIAELGKIGRLAGMTEADFKTCMANQTLLQSIVAERQGGEKLGVDSTPTFFVNGTKAAGAMPFAEFEKLLK